MIFEATNIVQDGSQVPPLTIDEFKYCSLRITVYCIKLIYTKVCSKELKERVLRSTRFWKRFLIM